MSNFSPQISSFLKNVGAHEHDHVSMVPKSDSCASPGDILFFRYSLNNLRGWRLFLLVEPITKQAGTGNLLLTGFKVPTQGNYTPDSLETLYKNRELPKENYRTYIMTKIHGPLRRIRK